MLLILYATLDYGYHAAFTLRYAYVTLFCLSLRRLLPFTPILLRHKKLRSRHTPCAQRAPRAVMPALPMPPMPPLLRLPMPLRYGCIR